MRVCSVAGCPTIYDSTASRCPIHETAAKQKHWDKTRAYSTAGHRAFRAAVLAHNPICVICHQRQSTIADHHPLSRRELEARGLNPNDPAAGRALCKPCHDRQTAIHQPGGWNAR
jgi:5-methylcytosine-specific restriction protein A